jgi:hypothetical protein
MVNSQTEALRYALGELIDARRVQYGDPVQGYLRDVIDCLNDALAESDNPGKEAGRRSARARRPYPEPSPT